MLTTLGALAEGGRLIKERVVLPSLCCQKFTRTSSPVPRTSHPLGTLGLLHDPLTYVTASGFTRLLIPSLPNASPDLDLPFLSSLVTSELATQVHCWVVSQMLKLQKLETLKS